MSASSVEFESMDPLHPQAQHCLRQYYAELNQRFHGGFDPHSDGPSALDDFKPPHGCFLVARLFGDAMGCGALRTFEAGVGEIKRMWIAPSARGLGIGRRLLAALEQEALSRKLRVIRLDTNKSLSQAQRLYRSSGYHQIKPFNDNPYAQLWFEKELTSPD